MSVSQERDDRYRCLPENVVVAGIAEGMYALTQAIQPIRSNCPYDRAHPQLRERGHEVVRHCTKNLTLVELAVRRNTFSDLHRP